MHNVTLQPHNADIPIHTGNSLASYQEEAFRPPMLCLYLTSYAPEVQPDTPVKRRHLEYVVNAFCLQDHTVESQEEAMNKPLTLNQPLLQQKHVPPLDAVVTTVIQCVWPNVIEVLMTMWSIPLSVIPSKCLKKEPSSRVIFGNSKELK